MNIFGLLHNAWVLLFAWMPPAAAIICIVLIGLIVIILLIKMIAFILDAIPFL